MSWRSAFRIVRCFHEKVSRGGYVTLPGGRFIAPFMFQMFQWKILWSKQSRKVSPTLLSCMRIEKSRVLLLHPCLQTSSFENCVVYLDAIVLCHLPDGPTAYFKINNLKFTKDIKRHGKSTEHMPEVILNNFNTRLGHTVESLYIFYRSESCCCFWRSAECSPVSFLTTRSFTDEEWWLFTIREITFSSDTTGESSMHLKQ